MAFASELARVLAGAFGGQGVSGQVLQNDALQRQQSAESGKLLQGAMLEDVLKKRDFERQAPQRLQDLLWKQKQFQQKQDEIDATNRLAQSNFDLKKAQFESESEEKKQKKKLQEEQTQRQGQFVVQEIGRALDLAQAPGLKGFLASGQVTGRVPFVGPAQDLDAYLQTIKANVGFDRLQQMRNASPTGGALGQISDKEREALQATLGTLKTGMSTDLLVQNLKRLHNQIQDTVHGQGVGPRFPLGFDSGGKPKSETVRVVSPDGRTGTIPRSQLEQAKQQGYREAQ